VRYWEEDFEPLTVIDRPEEGGDGQQKAVSPVDAPAPSVVLNPNRDGGPSTPQA
jgi:hypothetical protein